jgi:hypothetical protein
VNKNDLDSLTGVFIGASGVIYGLYVMISAAWKMFRPPEVDAAGRPGATPGLKYLLAGFVCFICTLVVILLSLLVYAVFTGTKLD